MDLIKEENKTKFHLVSKFALANHRRRRSEPREKEKEKEGGEEEEDQGMESLFLGF